MLEFFAHSGMAGVSTFLAQGIRPASWQEKERATKAARVALGLSSALLAVLNGLVTLFGKADFNFQQPKIRKSR